MTTNNSIMFRDTKPQDLSQDDYSVRFLLKNCRPALDELSKNGVLSSILYSGRRESSGFRPVSYLHHIRKDRTPRDTPIMYHNFADDMFLKHFGYRARSESIFVTGCKKRAETYGDVYAVFPVGEFKYIYHPWLFDFYIFIRNVMTRPRMYFGFIGFAVTEDDKKIESLQKRIIEKKIKKYTTTKLRKGVRRNSEIMVSCEHCYMIRYDRLRTVLLKLSKHSDYRLHKHSGFRL